MSTKPLSQRAYETALRMAQADSRIVRPNLEDFAHLDVTPSSHAEAPVTEAGPVAAPAAVADALARMQDAVKVQFAEPVEQSPQPRTQWYGGDGRDA